MTTFERPPVSLISADEFYVWITRRFDPRVSFWSYYLFFSRDTALQNLTDLWAHQATIRRASHPHLPVFTLSRQVGRLHPRRLTGWFALLPSTVSRIYKLVTVGDREFWRDGILRTIRSTYPRLAPAYFMPAEFRHALEILHDSLTPQFRLNVVRASTKERIMPGATTTRTPQRHRSNVTYTHEALNVAVQLARERGQSFRSLTIDVTEAPRDAGQERPVATFTIAREGWISWETFPHQRFDLILERVLLSAASDRLGLFTNRGRLDRDHQPDVPIEITFQNPVFEDRRLFRAFSALIARYPRSSKALLHQNPYYHAALSDQADGSAFDVWVLNPRRLLVIPRLRASEASLNRFARYIVEQFREGEISNYQADD
jgi:hypothetical protein